MEEWEIDSALIRTAPALTRIKQDDTGKTWATTVSFAMENAAWGPSFVQNNICSGTRKILRSMIKVNCVDGKPNCHFIFLLIWPFSQLPLPQITRQPPTRKSKAADMFFFPDGASEYIFKNLMLMLHHRAHKTLKDRNLKAINYQKWNKCSCTTRHHVINYMNKWGFTLRTLVRCQHTVDKQFCICIMLRSMPHGRISMHNI